jgi:hypothetical protein
MRKATKLDNLHFGWCDLVMSDEGLCTCVEEKMDSINNFALSIIPPKYEDNKERPLSVFETTFNMVVDQMREKVNGK